LQRRAQHVDGGVHSVVRVVQLIHEPRVSIGNFGDRFREQSTPTLSMI
jgi:hypothetical protein